MTAPKKKTPQKKIVQKTAPAKQKAVKAATKSTPAKKTREPEQAQKSLKIRIPKYYGYEKQDWLELKKIVMMAGFKYKISKLARNHEGHPVVALAKKFVLTRSRVHIEKAAAALCPGSDDAWAAIFKTREKKIWNQIDYVSH